MPDRVIRDELLESPRFLGLKDNADRLAYIALLLSADDLGNFDGDLFRLTRLWRDFGILSRELAAKSLSELADADLVRPYQIDGKPYLHLPRFRQRLRYTKGKYPRPPANVDTCNINELQEKSLTTVRPQSVRSQAQDGRSEEKRSEEKRSKPRARNPEPVDNSGAGTEKPVGNKLPKTQNPETREAVTVGALIGQWWRTPQGIEQRARLLGVVPKAGESHSELKQRLFAAEHGR